MNAFIDRVLKNRNDFPTWINTFVNYVGEHPMGIIGRLLALRYWRPAGGEDHYLSVIPTKPIRVLIAPVNYSNQATAWAAALEKARPSIGSQNMAVDVPGGFSFPADVVVPVPMYQASKRWQRAQFARIAKFTHVLIEAEEPLCGRLFGRDVTAEASALTRAGVSVAFLAHGTDIRRPSLHMKRNALSPYFDSSLYSPAIERRAIRNIATLRESGRPVFVSTPDLLQDYSLGIWCPVVVEPWEWSTGERARVTSEKLRVVHAPTSGPIKGTDLIEPSLWDLHERGLIDYRPIRGVPFSQMKGIYADADVVLDQFRLGSYGVAACEAMAAGCVVIGNVSDEVRAHVSTSTGRQVPIVQAVPATIEEVILRLIERAEEFNSVAAHGRAFVNHVHDGRLSAQVLIDNWIEA
jgi:hypothetical protein